MTERRRYAGLLAHPAAEMMPLLDADAARALAADIKANGLRVPVIVLDGQILDGRNRAAACEAAGVQVRTEPAPPGVNPWRYVWSLNAERRHLEPTQRTAIALRMTRGSDAYEAEKKAREDAANANRSAATKAQPRNSDGTMGPNRSFAGLQTTGSVPDDNPTPRRPVDTSRHEHVQVAEIAGVSPRTAASVISVAKKAPDMFEKMLAGEMTANEAERVLKENAREQRRQENAKLAASTPAPTTAGVRFATILIDPPWDWGDEGDVNQLGRAKPDYATMSIEQLHALPVGEISDVDCHIYMWITNRSAPKGFALLESWGFRYVTMLTWPKPSFGMGNYFRGQTEHIIFGVKGSQQLRRKDASTLLPTWQRGPNGHSSKPGEIYEFIESCSPGPYVEMFSRVKRDGWSAWGANA